MGTLGRRSRSWLVMRAVPVGYLISQVLFHIPGHLLAQEQCHPIEHPNPDDFTYLSALYLDPTDPLEPERSLTTGTENRCFPEFGDVSLFLWRFDFDVGLRAIG